MTTNPAVDLPAGEELDQLVAEKVLGWKRPTREYQPWDKSPTEHPGCCLTGIVPSFSKNLGDAESVLLRLVKLRDGDLDIRVTADEHGWEWVCGWNCDGVFFVADNDQYEESVSAETLPLAICRAALKAVQESEGAS